MIPGGTQSFHGIYHANVCPLKEDLSIDENALAKHVTSIAAVPGIIGVLCNGHAGENFTLNRAEKRRVVEIVRDAIGDRKVVVSGINSESSAEAAEQALDARKAGADALLIFPPFSWALSQDDKVAVTHHRMVIEAVGNMPIMLYQAPVGSGMMAYGPAVLEQLVRLPHVVGIKEGSWETSRYEANLRLVRRIAPHVAVMASGDEHLFPCFVLGSDGSQVSIACLIPEAVVALDEAVRRDDLDAARTAHNIIYPLAKVLYGTPPGSHATARIKTALKLLGKLDCDSVRPPLGPLGPSETEMLADALRTCGLL